MKANSWHKQLAILALLLGTFLSQGWAQYDIKQMTPEVEQAIQNRQARYAQLQELKAQGAIGENNRGYVEAIGGTPNAAAVASAENGDRTVIYRTIAEQNNLGETGLAIIETVFAEVQHEKARPGDSVQNSTGEWVKK